MNALLLDPKSGRHYTGETHLDLALATGRVAFDFAARTCVIQHSSHPHLVVNPTSHTLSYGDGWGLDALQKEMASDAVSYLRRNCGFVLYRIDS